MLCQTLVGHGFPIPSSLTRSLRGWKPCDGLKKFDVDIWISRTSVAQHTDGTLDNLVTYGLILINDPGYLFVHDDRPYHIPVGSLYRMDGRVSHKTHGGPGLFAALIWDMPNVWALDGFKQELSRDKRWNF